MLFCDLDFQILKMQSSVFVSFVLFVLCCTRAIEMTATNLKNNEHIRIDGHNIFPLYFIKNFRPKTCFMEKWFSVLENGSNKSFRC